MCKYGTRSDERPGIRSARGVGDGLAGRRGRKRRQRGRHSACCVRARGEEKGAKQREEMRKGGLLRRARRSWGWAGGIEVTTQQRLRAQMTRMPWKGDWTAKNGEQCHSGGVFLLGTLVTSSDGRMPRQRGCEQRGVGDVVEQQEVQESEVSHVRGAKVKTIGWQPGGR